MDKFQEALQQHKDNLTKSLSTFGEGHRLNRMHNEIDSNAADYEYYFNAGQQSQQAKVEELQKRMDAVKGLAQTLWEKSNEKHTQGKVWESKALGECADEILDVLEQALKGEG
ncbi:hypothetical protein [Acinetobacter pittii]|uniref:hypothetical protein n=1 Tax=Acinetobacter pittii TaxID=48296 RepID=UPI001F3F883A|nr:hypothetical protein [Acinetobacter pittii]MCE6238355.1 hypothetical protein [Acinetobacter pittii]MCE6689626.1 hypothetical protein [Acinetobacter pittii]MCE6697882.1 hypothetical protein [Acinetobacter pittii]MDA2253397.1 hypothetical protein [Bacillus cereus]